MGGDRPCHAAVPRAGGVQGRLQLPGPAAAGGVSSGTQRQEGATELSPGPSPAAGVGHPVRMGTLAQRHPPPAQGDACRGACAGAGPRSWSPSAVNQHLATRAAEITPGSRREHLMFSSGTCDVFFLSLKKFIKMRFRSECKRGISLCT